MKLRPILFSTPMVMALLAGTKTQTRRIVKPQPDTSDGRPLEIWYGWPGLARSGDLYHNITPPYGRPGDVLWVRETLYYDDHSGDNWCYQAGNNPVECEYEGILTRTDKVAIPSIHMPFIAARLFLEITNIRIELLQNISPNDAWWEGVEGWNEDYDSEPGAVHGNYRNYLDDRDWFANTVDSYQSLWESINGPNSWAENPWVWVVEFKQVDKPVIDGQ